MQLQNTSSSGARVEARSREIPNTSGSGARVEAREIRISASPCSWHAVVYSVINSTRNKYLKNSKVGGYLKLKFPEKNYNFGILQ